MFSCLFFFFVSLFFVHYFVWFLFVCLFVSLFVCLFVCFVCLFILAQQPEGPPVVNELTSEISGYKEFQTLCMTTMNYSHNMGCCTMT